MTATSPNPIPCSQEPPFPLYKETNFQETTIGKIPKDWQIRTTEDLFTVETGTTPSTKEEKFWADGTVNWITPTDLSKLNGKLRIGSSERKVTEEALKETNLTLMHKGSIILSTRAPVGYVATLEEDAAFNQGCKGLIPKKGYDVFPDFYSYYISNKKEALQNLSCGSTFLELAKNRLEKFSMPYFPISEQRAIVGVLGVVDSALDYTDRVIARCERLKRGLMQQLLTHGIGHTETKQTPIGNIPKEWQIVELKEILDVLSGQYFKFSEFTSEGVRCLKIDNVGFGEVIWDGTTLLPSTYLKDYPELALKEGDIVLALNRPIIGGKVKVGMVTAKDIPSILYQRVGKLIPKDSLQVDNKFLLSIFTSEDFKNQLKQSLVGTDQPYIRTPILLKIKIPLPPKNEQQKMVEIFSNINRKLWLEQQERARLEKIKSGLMDLLLTGKVRIKVD